MAISDTGRRILAEAARHPLRLAVPPSKLPTAATRAVLNSLLKQGHVEVCEEPEEFAGLHWHQQDGTRPTMRITTVGLTAIGATPVIVAVEEANQTEAAGTVPADAAQEPGSAPLALAAAPTSHEGPTGSEASPVPSTAAATRLSLRDAAHRVLAAWDDEAGERADLADAMAPSAPSW